MKYLKEISLLSEIGTPFEQIIASLHSRTDDECYSAFHWVENAAHKWVSSTVFPLIDSKDPKWIVASMPKNVLAFMNFPEGTDERVKELVALGVEHVHRDAKRNHQTDNFNQPTPTQ